MQLFAVTATEGGTWASVRISTKRMNMSALRSPSTLPVFGGSMATSPMPAEPNLTSTQVDASCPPAIQLDQITRQAPTLPYRVWDDYDCGGGCGLARARGTPGELATVVLESATYLVSASISSVVW